MTLSNQIYKSRDEIKNQIIENMRNYLELENIDMTKSSYLSFLTNTLATLTSNLIFYESSTYKEFFLTKAQLDESIYSLSAGLGYDVKKAQYSTTELLFTIPLTFESTDVTINIPSGFKALGNNIEFRTDYDLVITIENNSNVSVKAIEENKSYNLSVFVEPQVECYFLLPVKQIEFNEQEFQIEDDIKPFQFTYLDVSLNGKLSDISVSVKGPNSDIYEPYEEFSSLFLIGSDERGFVQRRTSDGVRVYFGNGLIGYQPQPASTVLIDLIETQGEDGNVMAGTIKNGERIYVYDNGERQVLNYTITNILASEGGVDEESIEEIRVNSINNLRSMDRLVSSLDYNNVASILGDTSVLGGGVAVLKRSDLKVNEIQLFTTLYLEGMLLPHRNEIIETTNTYIPRYTSVFVEDNEFITALDMNIDTINKVATYSYYIDNLTIRPELETSYDIDEDCDLIILNNDFTRNLSSDSISIDIGYSVEDSYSPSNITAEIQILETQDSYETTNNIVDSKFETTISLDDLPYGNINMLINIYLEGNLFRTYSSNLVFKKDLSDKMMSNVVIDTTTGGEELYIIYDVPVGLKSYFDEDNIKRSFEQYIMQKLGSLNLEEKRMLTDFINLKVANTIGTITNMLNNEVEGDNIISIVEELPDSPLDVGDRYILEETGAVVTYKGSGEWSSVIPPSNTILYVESAGSKMLFNGQKWLIPTFTVPLNIQLEVFVDEEALGNETLIIETIKDILYDEFSGRFGADSSLYRSEIINTVHSVDDVKYCYLIRPESDIFFNYDVDDFTQQELLEYTPELVHFTKDSISIRVFRG